MKAKKKLFFLIIFWVIVIPILVFWFRPSSDIFPQATKNNIQYDKIEWVNLIPKGELEILLNPPDALNDIIDGSQGDSLEAAANNPELARYQQALTSVNVVESYNQKNIKIPGFIVPIEFTEDKKVTGFFLVPYFGACLHMPPPPPNQVIYGSYPEGLAMVDLYQPFWIAGELNVETIKNDTATSAYTMQVDEISIFTEEDDRNYGEAPVEN